MYVATVLLLLLIFPLASVVIEAVRAGHTIADMLLIGKWYVFWAVGVRLFAAGLRQAIQPAFTAVEIFEIKDPKALAIVREVGFGNLSIGLLGLLSLWHKDWRIPAGIAGGLYYGIAGLIARYASAKKRQGNGRHGFGRIRVSGAAGLCPLRHRLNVRVNWLRP